MNQRNRARAGSSARLADHGAAAIATSVIFALAESAQVIFGLVERDRQRLSVGAGLDAGTRPLAPGILFRPTSITSTTSHPEGGSGAG